MNKKINLVLSGGGARGIAHIGIIEVLQEKNYQIQSVSGTSMGGLVGGIFAAGNLPELKKWLINIDIKEIVKMLDFSLKLPGLIKGEKVMKKIDGMLPIKNIEELPIPFTAVATDLQTDQAVYFNKGNIIEAIRASIAIPTIFTPVIHDRQIWVDGGLVNNIPVNIAQKLNNFPIVAVCVNADLPVTSEQWHIMKQNKKTENEHLQKINQIRKHIRQKIFAHTPKHNDTPGYSEILDHSLHLMISQISNEIIKKYPPDLLIEIPRKIAGTFDFFKAEKLIQIGRKAAFDTL